MKRITLDEAKANLQAIIQDVIDGNDVIITKDNKSLVKIVPMKKKTPTFGSARGLLNLSDDFDAPIEDLKNYI
ncbi:MAG: type II toxin-antitoxin system prevent-host-death family antitoxin [Nitrospirae bacterium]|nr:type II toxin-antitoxin system prevent-host-death family antitoxin [Nitrospirota bacterium]